jgi:RHS repeat-associated protein
LNITVDPTTNRINMAGFAYDAAGNLTQTPEGNTYAYDSENRLSQVNGGATKYYYDASGQRLASGSSGAMNTWQFWGPNGIQMTLTLGQANQSCGDYVNGFYSGFCLFSAGGGKMQHDKLYFAGRLVFQEDAVTVTDRLGSVVQESNHVQSSTSSLKNQEYFPYGVTASSISSPEVSFATYEATQSGLLYAKNRYYDPARGRFTTPDPYGGSGNPANPSSWNRYTYAGNDPINLYDPSGLDPFTPFAFPCTVGAGYGEYLLTYCELYSWGRPNLLPLDPPSGKLSKDCLDALRTAGTGASAVKRALAAESTLESAVQGTGIDWTMLAAIGIRESGFLNVSEKDGAGVGVGVFQITVKPGNGVTAEDAGNLTWAADYSANMLGTNLLTLAKKFPNFTVDQLLQATAASFNFGTGNISGNPNTIDVGTAPGGVKGNYGSNVMNIMNNCLH